MTGNFNFYADARMPVLGASAIASNLLLLAFGTSTQRWFYIASVAMLTLFVLIYNRWSKPINRVQTKAAKAGSTLNNARELQASWERSLVIRVPLLVCSLLAKPWPYSSPRA